MISDKVFHDTVSMLAPDLQDIILRYMKQKDQEIEGLELEIEDLSRPKKRRKFDDE